MIKRMLTVVMLLVSAATCKADGTDSYDVVVYGGTSCGVVAAMQANRMGKSVCIIEPGKYLGGLTTGGLGATDIGNKAAIGGLSREFYRSLGKHYGEEETWKFEPHVAEKLMNDMARESKAAIYMSQYLVGVEKDGAQIKSIKTSAGRTIHGRMFIDASYEGDLMAKAGVSYAIGREANSQYDETLNGVQPERRTHQFDVAVDPYRIEGDPASGLLPRIQKEDPGRKGDGDKRVQAYNFRMCLTKRPEIRVPFARPEGYDPSQYALLARYLQKAEAAGKTVQVMNNVMLVNGKTDTNNNGAFSTDNIGMNYDYADADWPTREKIVREHEIYQKGFMYFLANDRSVPEKYRKEASEWGLARDEFTDNGHWPHQLYVREARRMISDCVMTQHHCDHRETVADPVSLAAYNMDSHNVQRYAKDGRVWNEGDVQVAPAGPYPISYRSIVPKEAQCANLLVPVCLSSTHIAYGSIRMEPVFMILGQSSATAACMALEDKVTLQKLDYAKLKARLLADGQILEWKGPVRAARKPVKLPGIVIDDTQAVLKGDWAYSASTGVFVGDGYLHDGNDGKGEKTARFPVKVDKAGKYRVRLSVAANPNRATNVPVTIRHAEGEAKATVNQQAKPDADGCVTLGEYSFKPDVDSYIEISNAGTQGHVTADAVQFTPVE